MAIRNFKGYVSTKYVGSKATFEFEIDTDDEMSDQEIEEYAREIMFEHIEWNYEETENEAAK